MKVWIVTIDSESGDHYAPLVFSTKPSEEFLKQYVRKEFDYEFDEDDLDEGPGTFGGYIHAGSPIEIEVIDL
jgi:hypothetical protein